MTIMTYVMTDMDHRVEQVPKHLLEVWSIFDRNEEWLAGCCISSFARALRCHDVALSLKVLIQWTTGRRRDGFIRSQRVSDVFRRNSHIPISPAKSR